MILGLGKAQIYGLEAQGRAAAQIQRQFAGTVPLAWGRSACVLLRPSADPMRPTHIMEGHLLCSKSTGLNFNLQRNAAMETSRMMLDQLSEHCVNT